MEERTLKVTLKETKHHICGVEPQGLPNLIGKESDGKPKRQLKHAQWCGCHLQRKVTNKMGKGQPNYEVHKNDLKQKEDHPKDPLDKYQCKIK